MDSIFSLTNNLSYLKSTNDKIIALDKIYSLEKNRNFNHKNIQIIQNKPKDKKELIEVYEYCNIIYKRLLQDLSLELNRLHDLKKSPESWEVIIGKWLLGLIYISHNNFKLCEKILSEEKLSCILMMDSDKYSLHTKETLDFFWATRDSDWNLSLNSKIINFLNLDIKKKIIKLDDNKFDKYKSTSNILFLLKKNFFKIFNKINNKNNILVYSTSLNIIQEKKLELILGQIPKFWTKEEPKYTKDYNHILRKKISFKKDTEDKFENFIRSILPDALPLYILESFKDLEEQMIEKNLPTNPSKVFTCYGYAYDELFKIYLSQIKEKKIPIYVGQHGNNYFTSINTYYLNEFNTCDKFISWGAKDTNKVVPGFNLNTINRKINYKKKGNLLVVCGAIGTGQSPIDRNTQDEKNVNVVVDLVKQLKINKKFIKIRPHLTHFDSFNGYYYYKYLKKLNVNKNFLDKNIFKLIKKSRVVFFNYDSTGLLENLSLNIPSVCFWHDTYSHIDDKYIGKYKKLVEGKILFENFDDLIKHLDKYWDNIDDWWLSLKTQSVIKEFNENLNINGQKLTDLAKILKI